MANQDINKIKKIKLPNEQEYVIDATYWGEYETSDVKTINGVSILEKGGGDITITLPSALKYCGITTTPLEDGSTVNPVIINENEHLASTGCVVFYDDKEFVFNANSEWELFGAEKTYKVVQNPVSSPNVSGDATAFIDTISQDANGVISVTKKNVDMPIVKGDVENSAVLKGDYEGYSNKAISQVSVAVGAASTSGLKGWYYNHVNFDSKQIFLTATKPTGTIHKTSSILFPDSRYTDTSFESGYEKGDILSIVFDSKYEDYATITDINGNVITLDKLPFDSSKFNSTTHLSNITNIGQPDEFSVYCIKRQFNDTTKELTLSKYNVGGVDFGGGALSEGVQTYAVNIGAHAEGAQTVAKGQFSHAEGLRTQSNYAAHAEGINSIASGYGSHAEGSGSIANGESSHAEGYKTQAIGKYSHTEGCESVAAGANSHAEGQASYANKNNSHAEGQKTIADGEASHSEGRETIASGNYSHAEGRATIASNNNAHAEGQETVASGHTSHAEGWKCIAGISDTAPTVNSSETKGNYTHAEGNGTWALGNSSHAEGKGTNAEGLASHAEGLGNKTQNLAEHAQGKYNVSTKDKTIHSVGIGTSDTKRKNAHEITTDGKHYILGIGNYDGTKLDGATDIATYLPNMVEITHKELKNLRDISQLVPGQQYRITDYVTTTIHVNTQSANHQFDIIVTADDVNVLNENARAIQHEFDDTNSDEAKYFANSSLAAWELKYCLDNDIYRFIWADDSENGKGVIYYMKDEWNNECPYDFKNIQFARWELSNPVGYKNESNNWVNNTDVTNTYGSLKTGFYGTTANNNTFTFGPLKEYKIVYTISSAPTYCYTFGKDNDYSLIGDNHSNVIKEYNSDYMILLNNIVFIGTYCDSNTFGTGCSDITFGAGCYLNTFGYYCDRITFGNWCQRNTFGAGCYLNTFGNNCYKNTFGNDCDSNTFGNDCSSNTFGNNCDYNTFGNGCQFNTFGNDCSKNLFSNNCLRNVFGNACKNNIFGNGCNDNNLGNSCVSIIFGGFCRSNILNNNCIYISFGESSNSPLSYYRYITIDSGNRYINLYCNNTTTSSSYFQNVRIGLGVNNTSTYKTITNNNINQAYETHYKPADSQTISI